MEERRLAALSRYLALVLKKALSNVDVMAGLGAGAYAVAALYLPDLAALVDPRAAVSFALAALGRGYLSLKSGA